MGDTLNEFVKFIIGDPIMLGLCITIVVLIILFIIVLLMGKRQDKPEGEVIDKETEVFKTEIDMSPVMDTVQEPIASIDEENVLPIDSYVQKDDTTTEHPQEDAIEVPVVTDEPVALEVPVTLDNPMENMTTIEEPVESISDRYKDFPSFEDIKIQPDKREEPYGFTDSITLDFSNEDISKIETETPTANELSDMKVIESSINPLDSDDVNIFDTYSKDNTAPLEPTSETLTLEPIDESTTIEEKTNPYDSEAVSDFIELPSLKVQDFSKTSIMRNMPTMESSIDTSMDTSHTEEKENTIEEEDDDLALPKFNTNSSSPIVDAIKGESFNID